MVIRVVLNNLECFITWNFAFGHFDILEKFPGKKSVPTSNPAKFLESILATTINVKGS